MNICPITYNECGKKVYSEEGLVLLSQSLDKLFQFPYTAEEQRRIALTDTAHLSLPGTSLKLNARLNTGTKCFELSNDKAKYILKPQDNINLQIPENEDLTMRLAKAAGINVPLHGLIYCIDNSMTYFVKRFDRGTGKQKFYTEDFAQLSGKSKDAKYNSTMEELSKIIDEFCTFPVLEKIKLLKVVIFNYITGNSECHLKKFSVVRQNKKIELSPFYDLINISLFLPESEIEIALPLNGKRNNLNKTDFIDYYAKEILSLNRKTIYEILNVFEKTLPVWLDLIQKGFLTDELKKKYFEHLEYKILKFFKK